MYASLSVSTGSLAMNCRATVWVAGSASNQGALGVSVVSAVASIEAVPPLVAVDRKSPAAPCPESVAVLTRVEAAVPLPSW